MLEKVTHIEGLDAYDDVEVYDDTPPGVTQVNFEVRSEEMPFLSAKEGKIVRNNFIWIRKVMDLGRSILERRIYDSVEFDEITQKWKIKKLAVMSDIRRYPESWNAFMRGASAESIGTPISLIFKNDPSRAEMYKTKGIHSIEQLASLTDSHIQELGMGIGSDREKAKNYMLRIEQQAPKLALDSLVEEKDRQIASLEAKLSDLTDKFTKFMERETSPKKPRGRPRLVETNTEENI